jgi:TRAP-type C4-dicarboxylate transport system permease small subunit
LKTLRQWLDWVARGFAFAGGAVLVTLAGMSVISVAGRALVSKPVPGDFELVQIACAACIAAFLPYCQIRRGNIIVDFFTTRAPRRAQDALDAFGALLLATVLALVAWRTVVGMLAVKAAGEATMIIGFPVWIGYAAMVPSLAFTAVVALYTALESWQGVRQ